MLERHAFCEPVIESFVQIDDHDHAGFHGDAEQCDVADPNGHAKVVLEEPLKNEATGHRVEGGKNQHHGLRYRMEDHVQQHEDHKEDDRKDDFQAFLGTQFKFVFAGPLIDVSGWELQFLLQLLRGLAHESAVVCGVQVNVNVTGQLAILVANHGRAVRKRNCGNLVKRNLRSGRSADQYPPQFIYVVAKVALVAHVDGIPLTTFNVHGHVHAADS